LTLGTAIVARAEVTSDDARWKQAEALEAQSLYEAAIAIYSSILADDSKSQRAMTRRAIDRVEIGQLALALNDAEASVALNPYSRYWAERGYLCKVRVCSQFGCKPDARDAIAILKSRFPDSIATAEAEIIERTLDGRDTAAAEGVLALEEEALALHEQGTAASRKGDTAGALAFFDEVISAYPATRQALRTREIRALLLGLQPDRTQDAIAAWSDLLSKLKTSAPNSRIVQESRIRLAALYHRSKQRPEALVMYQDLATEAADPQVASNAAVQAAGIAFELAQPYAAQTDAASRAAWAHVRTLCQQVRANPNTNEADRVRAELMQIETLCWERRLDDAISAAQSFFKSHEAQAYRQDYATVCFFAGEALQERGRYEEALVLFNQLLDLYQTEAEIWPKMDHIPRTYFRVWETLRRMKASAADINAAAEDLLTAFPESSYAAHVRIVNRQKGR
jgi:tetratricopeptide (TPR) repeat protein